MIVKNMLQKQCKLSDGFQNSVADGKSGRFKKCLCDIACTTFDFESRFATQSRWHYACLKLICVILSSDYITVLNLSISPVSL